MTILDYIQDIVSDLSNNNWTYYIGKLDEQNVAASDLSSPAVLLRAPLRYNTVITESGGIQNSYQLTIDFMQVVNPENKTADLISLFNDCEAARVEFLTRLNRYKVNEVEKTIEITGINTTSVNHAFNKNWAGLSMTISVSLYASNDICYA